MFSKEDQKATSSPQNAIPDRERVEPSSASGEGLIHYMADFGHFNAANPHAIGEKMDMTNASQKRGITNLNEILVSPDKPALIGLNQDGTIKVRLNQDGTIKDSPTPEERALTPYCVTSGSTTFRNWLAMKLSEAAWKSDGRYRRIVPHLLAILMENDHEKVAMVQEFICKLEPYSMKTRPQGSKGDVHLSFVRGAISGGDNKLFVPEFDDFTVTNWTRLLCMADEGKISLDEPTKNHIRNKLLVFHGTKFDDSIPYTTNRLVKGAAQLAGFSAGESGVETSENHILMVNSSAYIKNQMEIDNINPGSHLETILCDCLDKIYTHGLDEFNSIPYTGHTMDALLNLHDFAHEPVKSHATRVLDKIFYDYAIHSTHDGKSFRPFSRLEKRKANQHFMVDNQIRAFMTPLIGLDHDYYLKKGQSAYCEHAFTALTTTYRLPAKVYELATSNTTGYLAMTGQRHGNAEVSYKNAYGTGKQYLLSGGGLRHEGGATQTFTDIATSFFRRSVAGMKNDPASFDAEMRTKRASAEVVSRNPVLILSGENGPSELKDAVYLGTEKAIITKEGGPGSDSRGKNNSGIYFDTMTGAYPVHIPESIQNGIKLKPEYNNDTAQLWTLYEIESGLRIAVFDGCISKGANEQPAQLGIVLFLPGLEPRDSQALINTIALENGVPQTLSNHVKFPDECGSVMRGP